jgi:hypothetical protein
MLTGAAIPVRKAEIWFTENLLLEVLNMAIIQLFETTIGDTDAQKATRIVIVPRRSLPTSYSTDKPDEAFLRNYFEFETITWLDSVVSIPQVLAAILSQDIQTTGVGPVSSSPLPAGVPYGQPVQPRVFQFAEYVAFADVVPFESSPLALTSLAAIATKAAKGGPVVLGTVTAFVAVGATPLLVLAVPAGIVLCGGAISFGKWLDKNRDKICKKLFGI